MRARDLFRVFALCMLLLGIGVRAAVTVPTDVQQPGTQPGEVANLESPDKCDNCHGGYNSAVEPAHNWRGSMMAHAGRDPIFWATLAVAEQDFDGAGDLCLRCHSTGGWLAGRSTPTDGSGLASGDSDGVECDYCHKVTNPDNSEHMGVMNPPFVANDESEGYYGSGMSSMWGGNEKLGPFADAEPKHQFMMSQFHRSADFCGTCHDVSNPVVGDLAHNQGAQPTADPVVASGELGGSVEGKAAFNNPPYKYGVVERTFSEYRSGQVSTTLVKDYPSLPADLRGGALEAAYAAAAAAGTIDYEDGTPRYYTCQSCHVRPVTGTGANKRGIPLRTDMPLHDMTGGNYWMPVVIDYLNARGQLRLGGNMAQASLDAMHDGALRAREQLDLAATLQLQGNTLKVINHTGHKLISGYPEGRRMWLNIKFYDAGGTLVDEIGEYGPISVSDPLVDGETIHSILDLDDPRNRIYESHYGLTQGWASQLIGHGYDSGLVLAYDRITGAPLETLGQLAARAAGEAEESFHFVLNNVVVKDNRIPPYGFRYDEARKRNALPVPDTRYGGVPGGIYEYWDDLDIGAMAAAVGASSAVIDLLYQPTSWEYIQFLAHANEGSNAFLADEGLNLLDAWLNAGDATTRMAQPHVMASASWGEVPATCDAPVPVLDAAAGGNKQVVLAWQSLAQLPPEYADYQFGLYYDQAGKAQAIASQPWDSGSYTDTGLSNGQQYCYKLNVEVTLVDGCSAQSGFSNIICATPGASGQAIIGVLDTLQTGRWVTSGKGKNAQTTFEITDTFVAGDAVIIQGVAESGEAVPAGAVVRVSISDGSAVVASLESNPVDSSGGFELSWQTQAPDRKGRGGSAAGSYTATVTDVSLSDYAWDAVAVSVSFTLQ
ncbi:hypothetical protein FV139_11075 [Parahaliea maris]|uniref:Fibronectin type-III domain-containing protein n=1 Tax=Parahaliea maris TaxID=2716870 RepID=A0A5C8ZZW8_9GAMM|nr:hypothetical protein [Parahaliea maris]TXS94135.1 hypothetical protein FV139_11075 [Parahaliea maris]